MSGRTEGDDVTDEQPPGPRYFRNPEGGTEVINNLRDAAPLFAVGYVEIDAHQYEAARAALDEALADASAES